MHRLELFSMLYYASGYCCFFRCLPVACHAWRCLHRSRAHDTSPPGNFAPCRAWHSDVVSGHNGHSLFFCMHHHDDGMGTRFRCVLSRSARKRYQHHYRLLLLLPCLHAIRHHQISPLTHPPVTADHAHPRASVYSPPPGRQPDTDPLGSQPPD